MTTERESKILVAELLDSYYNGTVDDTTDRSDLAYMMLLQRLISPNDTRQEAEIIVEEYFRKKDAKS